MQLRHNLDLTLHVEMHFFSARLASRVKSGRSKSLKTRVSISSATKRSTSRTSTRQTPENVVPVKTTTETLTNQKLAKSSNANQLSRQKSKSRKEVKDWCLWLYIDCHGYLWIDCHGGILTVIFIYLFIMLE